MESTEAVKKSKEILDYNRNVLAQIRDDDETPYVTLRHWLKMLAVYRAIESLYMTIEGYEHALYVAREGKCYYAVSEQYLRSQWAKKNVGAALGSEQTWQSALIILIGSGLVRRIVASETSIVKNFKEIYEKATAAGFRVENILHVPKYETDVLEKAEEWIRPLKENTRLSKVTKKAIIICHGKEEADRIFLDIRNVWSVEWYLLREFTFRIEKTIENKGYVTKDQLLSEVAAWLSKQKNHKRAVEKRLDLEKVERMWKDWHKMIIKDAGAVYRRPTASEKKTFNLVTNAWILTKAE